jgi:ClpX C4-type zinc finger protein
MAVTGQTTAGMACSFCLMSDVAAMIAGPGVLICDSCVAAFAEILSGNKPTGLTTMADVQQNLRDDEDLLALLPKVAAAGAQPERQLALLVGKARARGITWAKIGAAMGMTRQAAWQRFSGEQ